MKLRQAQAAHLQGPLAATAICEREAEDDICLTRRQSGTWLGAACTDGVLLL